jgi:hypothetical protein
MRRFAAGMFVALSTLTCGPALTQIVLRVDTDMTQGPGETLTAIRVQVYSPGETAPRFDRTVALRVAPDEIGLPADLLGITPRGNDATRVVTVDVTAIRGTAALTTHRTVTAFLPGRTALLDVFLADRCRDPRTACGAGATCGRTGCEPTQRLLGDFVPLPDAGAADGAPRADVVAIADVAAIADVVAAADVVANDAPADAASDCAGGAQRPGGHCYLWSAAATFLSWSAAEAACVAWRGHLVSFNDAAEERWVLGVVAPGIGTQLWIGFTDGMAEGSWSWSDASSPVPWRAGATTPYAHWTAGSPNNGGGTGGGPENCAVYRHDRGGWDDRRCGSEVHPYVCER